MTKSAVSRSSLSDRLQRRRAECAAGSTRDGVVLGHIVPLGRSRAAQTPRMQMRVRIYQTGDRRFQPEANCVVQAGA